MDEKVLVKDINLTGYEIKLVGKLLQWSISNHWKVVDKLEEIKKNDVFEIKGIGRMKVVYITVLHRLDGENSQFIKRYLVRGER